MPIIIPSVYSQGVMNPSYKLRSEARCAMIPFTVFGFLIVGEMYLDFNIDIFADNPADAKEKILRKHSNLCVSSVCRSSAGKLLDY